MGMLISGYEGSESPFVAGTTWHKLALDGSIGNRIGGERLLEEGFQGKPRKISPFHRLDDWILEPDLCQGSTPCRCKGRS
mmetsp:Transcript_29249/g.67791  ORF Transcript_29249/g.67791 Transcript_29249/m.67791 type:complete len:80 (+) Transcript_29249:36-275(+)